jgi:hypothetical protein
MRLKQVICKPRRPPQKDTKATKHFDWFGFFCGFCAFCGKHTFVELPRWQSRTLNPQWLCQRGLAGTLNDV